MDRLSTDLGGGATSDFGARLKRRWWVVAVGLLLGLLAGAALLTVLPKQYTSTTAVLVTPVGPGSVAGTTSTTARTGSDVNLDTESQLVESAQVADAVRTLLRTDDSVTALQDNVVVTVPPNSSILSIAYTGDSAKAAQEGSHAFAQAYLTNRAATAKRQVDLSVAGLQTQLDAAQTQLRALTDKSAALVDSSPDKVFADAQRNVVISQINDLTARLAPLQTAAATPGQIITDAPLPKKASAPVPPLVLGGGLVVGLLLGLAAAVALDSRDRSLRGAADVARLTSLPALAVVPAETTPGALPGDGQAPVFDRLRNAVVGSEPTSATVQVSDAGGRGASGSVALQLARSLVRSSGTAVLVVAHPGSVLPGLTGTADLPGLADLLRGQADVDEVLLSVPALPGVVVVPAGRNAQELDSLLQAQSLGQVLASLRRSSSLVVETRGTGESAAAQAVAAHSAAVVLVAERGHTDSVAVNEASAGATRMGGAVAGVVLVPALRRRDQVALMGPGDDRPRPVAGRPAFAGSTSSAGSSVIDEPVK